MNWKSFILGICVLLGLGAAGAGVYFWKNQRMAGTQFAGFEPAEKVDCVLAHTESWRPTATMVGTVFALKSVSVSNEVAGTVTEVHFDSGSILEKGDPLLTLDTSTEEADLGAAEAAVRVADANTHVAHATLELAQASSRRVNEAVSGRAAAAMEADKAKSDLDGAQANLARMSAELDQAKARADQVRSIIAKKHIRAPFKCRTAIRTIHPGQYLKEGTEVVTLQSIDDRIYLDFALPQEQAWRVSPGATFMATSPVLGAEPVKIEVVALDSQVDMTTRNVRVRSIVDNAKQILRAGMAVEVTVPIGESQSYVAIPNVAVRRATFGDHVFLIGPSAVKGEAPDKLRASQRLVTLGPAVGDQVIVFEGLKVGDKVATSGSFKLHDGALVMPPNPPAAPGAPAPSGSTAAPAPGEATASSASKQP